MPQVFDRETGEAVPNLSPAEAQAGLVSGKLALDADAGPVALKARDGKYFTFDPDKVAGALQTNAYSLLDPHEELVHRVRKEEAAKGLEGSIGAGVKSAANQFLLGIPGAIEEAQETPEQREEREARESVHTGARMLGGAVGIGGSLLAGGGVFKAADLAGQAVERGVLPAAGVAEASLAQRLAGTAANYAAQGALMSSPQALIQGVVGGDWKKAGETLMWGVGAGALLGGGAGALREGAGAVAGKLGELLSSDAAREGLDAFANETALKAVGAERSQLNKLSEENISELGDYLHENGIVQPGRTRQELGDVIENLHKKQGASIGDLNARLDELMTKGTAAEDLTAHALKPGEIGDAIKTALDSPELRMPMMGDSANALDTIIASANKMKSTWVNGREVIPFDTAQDFLTLLRKRYAPAIEKAINEGGVKGPIAVTPLDEMKQAAYQAARDAVHKAADRVAIAAKEPDLVGALASAKQNYAKLSKLEQFAATLDRQAAGNRKASHTDFLHMGQGPISGVLQAAGAGIGGLLGGGVGALVGQQAARVPGMALDFLAKKWVEDKGMIILSSIAKRAAKEGPEVFSAVMASDGAKRLEASMGTVRDTVKRLAVRGLDEGSGTSDHMKHLLGGTSGLTHEQQHVRLADRLTELTSNPAAMAAATSELSAPFAAGSPELGAAYQAQMMHTMSYLHDAVPRPPVAPSLFGPHDFEPSHADRLAFHDKAEIVANPMAAMGHVARGTLSDAHLDALRTVWPSVYGMMQREILQFAGEHPDVKLPYPERQSVAKFMGQPAADGLSDHISALQAGYQPPAPQSNASGGKRRPRSNFRKLPSMGSAFSATQGPQWGDQK